MSGRELGASGLHERWASAFTTSPLRVWLPRSVNWSIGAWPADSTEFTAWAHFSGSCALRDRLLLGKRRRQPLFKIWFIPLGRPSAPAPSIQYRAGNFTYFLGRLP